ncbi:MAG: Bax inhibitor-1 family protein [Flavobacteriales bacterium]|nr:Bax inhibitor-1 family protein [Flavobacteriales bacterium]
MEDFQNNYHGKIMLSQATDVERVAFYKKTYTHVAGGVLAFIVFEDFLLQSASIVEFAISMFQGYRMLILLGLFMLVTNYAESTVIKAANRNVQYMGYALYIFAEAFIFVPLIFIAVSITESFEVLNQAAIVTLSLFTGISAIVFVTKKDFSFLRAGLTAGFFIAIGLIVAGILFGFNLGLWFSVGMCVLAAGSILYQTSNLIHKYGTEDYVPAALGLFASLMLLFWYVIQIFLSRD